MERLHLPRNNWWHWPALIGFGILLGLWAAAITIGTTARGADKPRNPVILTQDELDRELKYCHDKGMTTAHFPVGGKPIEKVWCLMEVPK
jgi:hypothetical protein